jgi:hypothetical protein
VALNHQVLSLKDSLDELKRRSLEQASLLQVVREKERKGGPPSQRPTSPGEEEEAWVSKAFQCLRIGRNGKIGFQSQSQESLNKPKPLPKGPRKPKQPMPRPKGKRPTLKKPMGKGR